MNGSAADSPPPSCPFGDITSRNRPSPKLNVAVARRPLSGTSCPLVKRRRSDCSSLPEIQRVVDVDERRILEGEGALCGGQRHLRIRNEVGVGPSGRVGVANAVVLAAGGGRSPRAAWRSWPASGTRGSGRSTGGQAWDRRPPRTAAQWRRPARSMPTRTCDRGRRADRSPARTTPRWHRPSPRPARRRRRAASRSREPWPAAPSPLPGLAAATAPLRCGRASTMRQR